MTFEKVAMRPAVPADAAEVRRLSILDWQASPTAVAFYEALGFAPDHVGDFPDCPGFTLDLRTGPRRAALTP